MEQPTTPPPPPSASSNPMHSTPSGKMNGRGMMSAKVSQLRQRYQADMEGRVAHVSFREFLLFLLSIIRGTTEEAKLSSNLEGLLSDAVLMCNGDKTVTIDEAHKDAFPEGSAGKKMNRLQELLAEFHLTRQEREEYAPFCKLVNTILDMKRMRSDSVAGLPAPSGDENRLVFRRHDPTPILSEHIGVDNYLLAGPTVRKPDVVGSTLRNALLTVKDNAKRQPMPGESWDKAWERYTNGLALSKPEIASSFGTLLVNLEFKRTAARMRSIPLEFKAGTEASGGLSVMASEASENDRVGQKRKSDGGSGVPSKRSKSKVVAGRSNNKSEKKDGEGEGEGEGRSKGRNESRAIQYETGIHEEDPDEAVLKLPPEIQIAIYAAERLSSSVAINHSFQFIINNSAISLWWFDRGSAIRSEEIDFITGLPYLVVLIDILRRFDEHAWGFNRTFRKTGTDDGKLQIDLTPLNKNQSSVTVTLDEKSHARPIYLFGRSTDVIPVRGTDVRPTWLGSSSEFVLKVYHPDEQRDSEVKILEKAYDVAFSNVKDSEYVRGHLPVLCASSDFEDEYAERITKILGISRETKQRCFRRLRVILFRRLHHIYELSGQEFLGAFIDCFRCHGVLWLNKVHHRDISEDNLMYTKVNGHVVGVLNDFDLSIYHDDDRSLANERTGTIPFMAHALLTAFRSGKPVAHLYEYDVESFAYVGLWICARYDEGKVAVHSAYRDWTAAYDPKLIAGRKRDNLTDALPSTASHSGYFTAICELAWQAEESIIKANRRRVGAQLGKQVEPNESPEVYFERLCRMLNETVEAIDPKYGEYIQTGAEVMMKDYKVPEELKHYLPTPNSASTDVGQVND